MINSLSQALFNLIFKIFFWLVGIIGSIIIYPIQAILVTIIPGLGDFIVTVQNFFATFVFPMLSFVKEVFIEITDCPRSLLSTLFTFILARWAIAPAIRSIKLIISIWKIKSGGKTN